MHSIGLGVIIHLEYITYQVYILHKCMIVEVQSQVSSHPTAGCCHPQNEVDLPPRNFSPIKCATVIISHMFQLFSAITVIYTSIHNIAHIYKLHIVITFDSYKYQFPFLILNNIGLSLSLSRRKDIVIFSTSFDQLVFSVPSSWGDGKTEDDCHGLENLKIPKIGLENIESPLLENLNPPETLNLSSHIKEREAMSVNFQKQHCCHR